MIFHCTSHQQTWLQIRGRMVRGIPVTLELEAPSIARALMDRQPDLLPRHRVYSTTFPPVLVLVRVCVRVCSPSPKRSGDNDQPGSIKRCRFPHAKPTNRQPQVNGSGPAGVTSGSISFLRSALPLPIVTPAATPRVYTQSPHDAPDLATEHAADTGAGQRRPHRHVAVRGQEPVPLPGQQLPVFQEPIRARVGGERG